MLHAVNHLWLIRTLLHTPFISLLCSPQEEAVCCVLLEAENMFMFLPRHSAGEMLMCVCWIRPCLHELLDHRPHPAQGLGSTHGCSRTPSAGYRREYNNQSVSSGPQTPSSSCLSCKVGFLSV